MKITILHKHLAFSILILVWATAIVSSQTGKKPVRVVDMSKPTAAYKPIVAEKTNGDRMSGNFVKGDAESITIQISGADVRLPISELKAVWFGDVTAPAVAKQEEPKNNISVEAAVIYRSGQVVPVARATFYLLDDDVVTILKNAGVNPPSIGTTANQDYSKSIYMSLGFSARYGSLPQYQQFIQSYQEAIKPHIKYQFETDFSGKANLTDIPKGNFYLFSIASTRQSGVVWNMPVDTASAKTLTLDQNNAVFAY